MASRRTKRTGSTEVIYKDLEFRSKSFHPVASRQRSNEHAQIEFANVYRDSTESEIGLRPTVRLKCRKRKAHWIPRNDKVHREIKLIPDNGGETR